MRIEQAAIKKYKILSWLDKNKLKIVYGIGVIMVNNKVYNCTEEPKKPLMYSNKPDAIKKVKELNKALREAQTTNIK